LNKKRWIALILFLLLVGSAALVQVPEFKPGPMEWFQDDPQVETVMEPGTEERIVVLDVDGMIMASTGGVFYDQHYHHGFFLNQLQAAYQDPQVKGVVVRVNSPGGGISESDEIFQRLMEWREEYEKPLVVFMDRVASSGAYYISAPADHIVATRTTMTGSIGVVMQSVNYFQLADSLGIEDVTFKSGPYKDLMNPLREMDEEEGEMLQALVDENFEYFVDAIVEGRGMDQEEVLEVADGRVFTGLQALEYDLVDSIGFLEDAVDQAKELAGVEQPTVVRIERRVPFRWMSLLVSSDTHPLSRLLPAGSCKPPLSVRTHPEPMYLWTW